MDLTNLYGCAQYRPPITIAVKATGYNYNRTSEVTRSFSSSARFGSSVKPAGGGDCGLAAVGEGDELYIILGASRRGLRSGVAALAAAEPAKNDITSGLIRMTYSTETFVGKVHMTATTHK